MSVSKIIRYEPDEKTVVVTLGRECQFRGTIRQLRNTLLMYLTVLKYEVIEPVIYIAVI